MNVPGRDHKKNLLDRTGFHNYDLISYLIPDNTFCAMGPIIGIGFSSPLIADIRPSIHKTNNAINKIQAKNERKNTTKIKIK